MDARSIGLICGIIVGLCIAVLVLKFVNRGGRIKVEYDELQAINRNKAYKAGFAATIIYTAILCVAFLIGIDLPMEMSVILFSIIFVGIIVVASTSLWNDSYWGLSTNTKRFWIVMIMVATINISIPFVQSGDLIIDGKLSTPSVNLLCGLLIVIVAAETVIKYFADKKAGGNDEES